MGIPLRALIIEDVEDDALMMIRVLKKSGYDPAYERVETADAMDEALGREAWDIILSDYNMPHFSGHAALALYKEKGLDIPFIIVSGAIGEEAAVATMISGAHDYVMKNNLARLGPVVHRELKETELRRAHKQVEEALVKNEVLLREAQRVAHIGHWELDTSTMTPTWSEEIFHIFGLDHEEDEPSFKAHQKVTHPDDWGILNNAVTTSIVEGIPFDIEFRILCPNQTITWMRAIGYPKKDSEGRVISVFGTAQDITGMKLIEETLKLSEQKYRSIFENSIEGIFQTSPEGRFISANPALARMIGYDTPAELMEGVTDLSKQGYSNPEDRVRYKKILEAEDVIHGFETQHYKKDGSIFWISINAHTVRDTTGKVLHYEGTIENITPRKLAEEKQKQFIDDLKNTLNGTVKALAATSEIRDPYTAGHQNRVAQLACAIAREINLSEEAVDGIRIASSLHDIGKISVPAEILSKPAKLNQYELSIVQLHSGAGYEILKGVAFAGPIANIVLQHHERLDGSGYPQALKNGGILFEAKIIGVADVVEAMASHRPYRPALGIDASLAEITKNRGKLYDEDVVNACVRVFKERGFKFE